jgi:hypothetical protein
LPGTASWMDLFAPATRNLRVGTRGRVLLAALVVVLATATIGVSARLSPLATFRPASGWLVERAGADNPSLVVAVTARDASVIRPVALFGTFKELSRDGVLVWADTVGRGRKDFPPRSAWPPRLGSFRVDHGWEGQPAPNIQQRVWVGSVQGWDLDVRIFFATQRPSSALRAQAQAELDRLRLP